MEGNQTINSWKDIFWRRNVPGRQTRMRSRCRKSTMWTRRFTWGSMKQQISRTRLSPNTFCRRNMPGRFVRSNWGRSPSSQVNRRTTRRIYSGNLDTVGRDSMQVNKALQAEVDGLHQQLRVCEQMLQSLENSLWGCSAQSGRRGAIRSMLIQPREWGMNSAVFRCQTRSVQGDIIGL